MAQKPAGPPHAGHQLHTLATAAGDAHAATVAAAEQAAAAAAVRVAAARVTKNELRHARLAAIEERGRGGAGHPEHHQPG